MEYTIEEIDDDNLVITYQKRIVGEGVFSHGLNEWFISISLGIPLNHLETILTKIKELRK